MHACSHARNITRKKQQRTCHRRSRYRNFSLPELEAALENVSESEFVSLLQDELELRRSGATGGGSGVHLNEALLPKSVVLAGDKLGCTLQGAARYATVYANLVRTSNEKGR